MITQNTDATLKQFLSNPRSNELRTICLRIVDLLGKQDATSEDKARLVALRHQLVGMDTQPGMQTGLAKSAYSDPVIMAEYVAGQILACLPESLEIDMITGNVMRNCTYRFFRAE